MKQNNLNGSICLTDLRIFLQNNPQLKQVAKNGKEYLNINVFFKDAPDQYGNTATLALKKLDKDAPTQYLGNLKEYVPASTQAPTNQPVSKDDLPF